ncbi:MAG: SUF system NifU family Fe-S cluster assembly protein [Chthonomonas sp.]|nr:SUF system NifU family Fe-S cluster assembly protein [Chthonomonas sp.]
MDPDLNLLVDHGRSPRLRGRLPHPAHTMTVTNPLCQDTVTVDLSIKEGVIQDCRTDGEACAICTASASIMATRILHLSTEQAIELAATIRDAMTSPEPADLGDLNDLLDIRQYPMRVKCVTLPWHAMVGALGQTL